MEDIVSITVIRLKVFERITDCKFFKIKLLQYNSLNAYYFFSGNHLAANIVNSIINASSIHFEWKNSSHSDLIQEYTVSIIDGNGTTITNTSVGKQTRFNFQYEFIHGNIYYCIFSTNVKIEHTGDLFTVIKEKQMVLGMS